MIHKYGAITDTSTRVRKTTVAISNRSTSFAISGYQTKRARLMRWKESILMKMMTTMSSGSLGANVIMCSGAIIVKLVKCREMSFL